MVKFIRFMRLFEIVMVIQMVAAKVFQKHDVAHDESDLIGAWLSWLYNTTRGRNQNILAQKNTRPKEDQGIH